MEAGRIPGAVFSVRSFLDSNVLLYAHDLSAGLKREVAIELVRGLWESRTGRLSIQVLQEFFVNATRKLPRPLNVEETREVVEDFSYWEVHRPGTGDVLGAIDTSRRLGISFWDAMIIRSAACQGCRVLYSEDLNAGQLYEGGVRVENPFADLAGSGAG